MLVLYNRIVELCAQRKVSPGKMCSELNLSRGMMTDLKMGRKKTLSTETLTKIASYFGVTVDYFLGNEQSQQKENSPVLTNKDERDIAREMEKMKESLESGELLMFDGDPLSDEAKESILTAMRVGMEMAKLKNKEKYTPRKYRK